MLSLQSANRIGTGTAQANYWSDLIYCHIACSGNSASASLLASPNGWTSWMQITAWAIGVNATATAYITGFYPYLAARVDWVSGAARTGTVNFEFIGRKMFP